MRTDTKRTPIVIFLYIVAAALLIALNVSGRSASNASGRNSQLFAKPLTQDATGADIWVIEDFNDENPTLVTYEIRRQASAYAVRESHRMNVVGTNSAYAAVMGYPVIDGGFFTKDAFLIGAKEAVLNERAAFTLFGGRRLSGSSFSLNDEIWTVVGIVLDEDAENDNIYVPASSELVLAGGASISASSLMVLQSGYSGAEASITSAKLKDLGAGETSHSFKNLGKTVAAFDEMAAVATRFALTLLLCLFAWYFGNYAFRTFKTARDVNEFYDLHGANDDTKTERNAGGATGGGRPDDDPGSSHPGGAPDSSHPGSGHRGDTPDSSYSEGDPSGGNPGGAPVSCTNYVKAVISVILFCLCAAAALVLARRIVEICITWQEIPLLLFETAAPQDAFYGRLSALGDRQAVVLSLFAASAIFSAAAQITAAYKNF